MAQLSFSFYIAGSFARQMELNTYKTALEQRGHRCTSRWLNGSHQIKDVQEDPDQVAPGSLGHQFAIEDVEDIYESDAIIFFSSRQADGKVFSLGRGGRHTEFGISWTLGKPIFFIGQRECAFHSFVPSRRCFYDWRSFTVALPQLIPHEIMLERDVPQVPAIPLSVLCQRMLAAQDQEPQRTA